MRLVPSTLRLQGGGSRRAALRLASLVASALLGVAACGGRVAEDGLARVGARDVRATEARRDALAGGCGTPACAAAPRATPGALRAERRDLARLTRAPDGAYVTGTTSSYDRRSTAPGEDGWFANDDSHGAQGVEGDARVLLDVTGPGAVVRLWSPNPAGTLRVALDDATALEAPLASVLAGAGAPPGAYAFTVARGANVFAPMTFARRARVTLVGGGDVYFQVDYRLYRRDASVEPGDGARDATSAADGAEPAAPDTPGPTEAFDLAPDAPAHDIVAPTGGGVLRALVLRPAGPGVTAESLGRTTLTIAFDGRETVRAPLSRLFARPAGARAVRALPIEASDDGSLTLRFPMPFAERARVAVEGAGAARLRATAAVVAAPFDAATRRVLHARWTGPIATDLRVARDWTIASLRGRGWYVGSVLDVRNAREGWWGEGDHRIYVDGEVFPSHFGTGTEDYFGYGWCSTERFSTAYFGQTRASARDSSGPVTLYRFHVADAIPFQRSLQFDLEQLHWATGGADPVPVDFDAVYFFYAGRDDGPVDPVPAAPAPVEPTPGAPPDDAAPPYACK